MFVNRGKRDDVRTARPAASERIRLQGGISGFVTLYEEDCAIIHQMMV